MDALVGKRPAHGVGVTIELRARHVMPLAIISNNLVSFGGHSCGQFVHHDLDATFS